MTIQDNPRDRQSIVQLDANDKHLSQQTARLEYIFHNIPGAVIVTDRHGLIHNMNAAAKALLGPAPKGLALRDWPDAFRLYLQDGSALFPADSLPPVRALLGLKDVPPVNMLLRSTVDQKEYHISMSAGAILAKNGSLDGVTTIIHEIAPASRSSASPDASDWHAEGLYRFSSLLAESVEDVNRIASSVAAITCDIVGDMSAVALLEPASTRLSLVASRSRDPALAARFRELTLKEVEFGVDGSAEQAVISSGTPVQLRSNGADGQMTSMIFGRFINEVQPESVLVAPLIGRTGPIGTITLIRRKGSRDYSIHDRSFLTDVAHRAALAIENCLLFDSLQAEISARLTTARALDLSEERFQSIFESTALGIKVLDLSGNIVQTNAAFQRIIGYAEPELVGRRFYDFLHPADMARAVSVFERVKRDGAATVRFQHRAIHKNASTVWVNAVFSAVRKGRGDDSLAFIVSILEDVTEQKEFEAEMAELKGRMQNMMELERLRLSHELHDGPMQDLYTAIYEIEDLRTKTGPEMREPLQRLSEEIQHVLTDLRQTAKELRPPTISQFGLEKTIRSYAADLQEKHPQLIIHLSLANDRQLLPEDVRLALFRVLQQGVTNIIRHANATEISVRFNFDAEEACLEISDNGRGFDVPPTWIDFVRGGHFGLAGAAERINAMGGTFEVESQPRVSTTVRAVIPWKEHIE